MATTTNYGWTTPDDTALVKDGAAAIRTLGSSVDTTTKNLNPETTLGDIAYRSSTANVKTRLGLGTAGQVLQVNSGANAPEWATPTSGGMTLINSGGTTLSGASVTVSSIPATYIDLYIIVANFKPATDNRSLQMYMNGDNAATKYLVPGSGLYQTNQSFTDGSITIVNEQDNGTDNGMGTVLINGYTLSTWKKFLVQSITNNATTATNANIRLIWGLSNITAAISSLTFFSDSGNMTSGTVYVYGVK